MGRLITYDNVVQEKLNSIIKNKGTHTGLIIGHCIEQKDIVLRLCPTPHKDEESVSNTEEVPKKKTKKPDVDIEVLDEQWICQHAKQLLRSLPGGLDILGLYVAAPSDFNTKQQAMTRQILFSVFKILSKNRKIGICSKDRIFLSICTVSSKITCRTFDIADFKCSATPAEWKLQSGSLKWQRVRCQLAVDLKFPTKRDDRALSIQKQIDTGLASFFCSIQDAHTLVNGQQRELSELLDASGEGKKSKKRQSNDAEDRISSEWHNVELFIPLENSEILEPAIFDAVSMMTFKGAVQCRAYVHGKATVEEAIAALKQDIIRSIVARCEIHCEDLLLIDEEQQDPLVVHELPRRVFAPLPQADICVCDYQFHSDTASDSLDAFKELLSLDLDEQDIDISCEKSPTTSTLILPGVMEDRLSEFGDAPPQSSMSFYVPVLGVVATLAVGLVSYMMAVQSN